jgi:hypothetical protein
MTRRLAWFIAFVSSICLEGLGRRYLPAVPSAVFYFLKDVVLLAGYFIVRPSPEVRRASRWLYRGFMGWWVVALCWTVVEVFNPENQSNVLALTGLRAYWLWWLAPVIVASALMGAERKRRAIYVLLAISLGVSVLAAAQFASPPESQINLYSNVDGEAVYASTATVAATGRARVSSTFSFVSGFSGFIVMVPTLLLSIGLETKDRKLRRLALVTTVICASVLPMTGSRASVLIGGTVLIITAWTAGLFFTSIGRRVMVGAVVAVALALVAFPEAFEGVQSRFTAQEEETQTRFEALTTILPPVALMLFDYPVMGVGTGMEQNARVSMNISTRYDNEMPAGRYLAELGPIGYLLVWVANLGLVVALVKASSILKRAGRRAAAGAALSYAGLALVASSPFDHVAQALFFMGCGFILSEVVEVLLAAELAARPQLEPQVPRQALAAPAMGHASSP